MRTINVQLSASNFNDGQVIYLDQLNIKGINNVVYSLSGISEQNSDALYLDIDWGDTTIPYHTKRGALSSSNSILTDIHHRYYNDISSINMLLSTQIRVVFRDNKTLRFVQPLQIFKPSYYDEIGDLNLLTTQILPLSTSNTFLNFEGKFNKQTYVCVLDAINANYFAEITQYYIIVSEAWEYLYSPDEEYYLSFLYSY